MAYPVGWPPAQPSGRRSLRFFKTGTTTADYADNAFLFALGGGTTDPASSANPYTPTPVVQAGSSTVAHVGDQARPGSPMGGGVDMLNPTTNEVIRPAMVYSYSIRLCNDGVGALEYSFDATANAGAGYTVHGILKAGEQFLYQNRCEAGIALRGNGGATPVFRLEAW